MSYFGYSVYTIVKLDCCPRITSCTTKFGAILSNVVAVGVIVWMYTWIANDIHPVRSY